MLETIVGALLPIVITMLLGYLAAKHHDFGPQEASILIRMVMTYALPVALFVGTVSRTRGVLLQDLPLLIVLTVAIVGLYVWSCSCVVAPCACRWGRVRWRRWRHLHPMSASWVQRFSARSMAPAASLPVALGNLVMCSR